MSVQLVQPNLATVGNIGWCLAFAENVFGTPHLYATATDGWHATHFPHPDRNLPTDVSVPIWYSYVENGLDYGHVAVNVPGRGVLSSPYRADNTQQWFKDIDDCARVLNCKYLGWSEDIATVRVIKEDDMLTLTEKEVEDYRAAYQIKGNNPDGTFDKAQMAVYTANAAALYADGTQYEFDRLKEANAKVDQLTSANLKLTDQLKAQPTPPPSDPNSVTVTKDGFWAAFKRFLGL